MVAVIFRQGFRMPSKANFVRNFWGFEPSQTPRPLRTYRVIDLPNCSEHKDCYVPQAVGVRLANRRVVGGHYLGGAYCKDFGLIQESITWRGKTEKIIAPFDVEVQHGQQIVDIQSGVYCGLLFLHYGHFLLETLSRCWYAFEHKGPLNLIFQTIDRRVSAISTPYAVALFDALRSLGHTIYLIDGLARVRNLLIPNPSFVIRRGFNSAFSATVASLSDLAAPARSSFGSKVYLTRTKLGKGRVEGEEAVEAVFSKRGFSIVSPEMLTFSQQISLSRELEHVGGIMGSAMHNLIFSSGTKSTLLTREHNIKILGNYLIVDEASRLDATYVNAAAAVDEGQPKSLDIKKALRYFNELE